MTSAPKSEQRLSFVVFPGFSLLPSLSDYDAAPYAKQAVCIGGPYQSHARQRVEAVFSGMEFLKTNKAGFLSCCRQEMEI